MLVSVVSDLRMCFYSCSRIGSKCSQLHVCYKWQKELISSHQITASLKQDYLLEDPSGFGDGWGGVRERTILELEDPSGFGDGCLFWLGDLGELGCVRGLEALTNFTDCCTAEGCRHCPSFV
jgi:hypothetical protein